MPLDDVELERDWGMLFPELADAPVIPAPCATVHAKLLPETFDVSATLVVAPLQIDCVEGVAVSEGKGLTVTTTFTEEPEQELAEGVIVYVAVPFDVPELVNV